MVSNTEYDYDKVKRAMDKLTDISDSKERLKKEKMNSV